MRDKKAKPAAEKFELVTVGVALVFVVAYALPILDPDSSDGLKAVCAIVVWVTWGLLAIDVVIRLTLAESKREFFRRRWLDVLAVALPVYRPLSLLRVVVVLGVIERFIGHSMRGRIAIYVIGSLTLTAFVGALGVLDAERKDPDANIVNFGDSLWWVATTLSTVGYGDLYPVTTTGRCVAVALMVVGVAFLGVVTAGLASWLIEQVRDIGAESDAIHRQDILAVHAEVKELRAELARRDSSAGADGQPESGED